jgi:hypothetical protein
MKLIFLVFGLSCVSCATSYKPIAPLSVNYNNVEEKEGVIFSYRYDVLGEKGNKKYAKKEIKKSIKVVAIRINNNGNIPLTVGSNLKIFSGSNEVKIIEPAIVQKELRQSVPSYLIYLLLTPLNLNITKTDNNGRVESESYPIGLGLGPVISISNMLVSGGANKSLLMELNQFNQINKTILPGQSSYGLIGIGDIGFAPLRIEINK